MIPSTYPTVVDIYKCKRSARYAKYKYKMKTASEIIWQMGKKQTRETAHQTVGLNLFLSLGP